MRLTGEQRKSTKRNCFTLAHLEATTDDRCSGRSDIDMIEGRGIRLASQRYSSVASPTISVRLTDI